MTARDRFPLGTRVRFALVKRARSRRLWWERTGRVVGYGRWSDLVRVQWDGRTTAETHMVATLEIAYPEEARG